MMQARLIRPGSHPVLRRANVSMHRGDLVKGELTGYWVVERSSSSILQPEEQIVLIPYERIENEYGFIAHYPVTFADGRVCSCYWLKGLDAVIRWTDPKSAAEELRQAFTAAVFDRAEAQPIGQPGKYPWTPTA